MYAEYFGLSEPPFSIAPDPRYLYPSAQHLEALAHLAYGATEGDGFIQLTGEVGTGKTTLIRRLLAQMPEGVEIAFLFNPELSRRGLLRALIAELGLARPPPDCERGELVSRVYRHLLAARTRGHRVVLVIDEAQRLGPDVLEEVRLLTNFETDRRKLLNVILVGQPELRETLARADLRQLAQRITARYHLGPFTLADTDAYIRHRLRLAGAPGRIFQPRAVRTLQRHSHGIPRLINLICDRALMAACTRGLREVDAEVVEAAARELAGAPSKKRMPRPVWLAAGIVLAALAGGGVAWWLAGLSSSPASQTIASPLPSASRTTATNAPSTAKPSKPSLALAARTSSASAPEPSVSLRDWLSGQTSDATSARERLLALWKVGVEGDSAPGGTPCAVAAREGLACVHEQGNLNLLRALNRPAVVTLHDANQAYRVIVSELDGRHVTLMSPAGESQTFSVTEFEALWYGRMWLLWRPPHGQEVIRQGMRGSAVDWLRQALGMSGSDRDGTVYDDDLEQAVRVFQRQHALVPDGIAGPETLIVLRQREGRGVGPRLSSNLGAQA